MSMSKKNFTILLSVALLLLVVVLLVSFYTFSVTGVLPWSFDAQFVANCASTTCTSG